MASNSQATSTTERSPAIRRAWLEHQAVFFRDQHLEPEAFLAFARRIGTPAFDPFVYAAFEALSPAMQAMLDPLRAVNSSALADVSKTRVDRIRDAGPVDDLPVYEAVHPVVRRHPETGRKALYVNIAHTERFDAMTGTLAGDRPR